MQGEFRRKSIGVEAGLAAGGWVGANRCEEFTTGSSSNPVDEPLKDCMKPMAHIEAN